MLISKFKKEEDFNNAPPPAEGSYIQWLQINDNGTVEMRLMDSEKNIQIVSGNGTSDMQYKINNVEPDASGNFTITPEDLGAAALVHQHVIDDVDGLTSALAGKSSKDHTHVMVTGITVNGTTLTGPVTIVGGDNVGVSVVGNSINIEALPFVGDTSDSLLIDGVTYKVFVGTQAEWDVFTPVEGIEYLVFILP